MIDLWQRLCRDVRHKMTARRLMVNNVFSWNIGAVHEELYDCAFSGCEPALPQLTFSEDVGPPQAVAACKRCNKTNRLALRVYENERPIEDRHESLLHAMHRACAYICANDSQYAAHILARALQDDEAEPIVITPDSVTRCYHCGELFSGDWEYEYWQDGGELLEF